MDEKIQRLKDATRALVRHIDAAPAYDKMADCGCGGVDPYRSDEFEALIHQAKEALAALEEDSQKGEAAAAGPSALPRPPVCSIRQPD